MEPSLLLSQIAAEQNLEAAFRWLCQRRKDFSHNSDIWNLRSNWPREKAKIKEELLEGRYKLDTLQEIRTGDEILFGMLKTYIQDEAILALLWQYLRRTVVYGENYREITQGITLRCSLSPLLGGLYLLPLDTAMAKAGYQYIRFMDDWLLVTTTRWHLRKAVKRVNRILSSLKLQQYPDKTYIGRAAKGLDFLGFHFSPTEISVSATTHDKHRQHITRLYELNVKANDIGKYVDRFWRWAKSIGGKEVCPVGRQNQGGVVLRGDAWSGNCYSPIEIFSRSRLEFPPALAQNWAVVGGHHIGR